MGTRGRKSAGDLSVVTPMPERPGAPKELGKAEAVVWREITDKFPAEFFKGKEGLLIQYCRHIVSANEVADLFDRARKENPDGIELLDKLGKMQERESRTLASLCIKLGIAQSASYQANKKSMTKHSPWSFK